MFDGERALDQDLDEAMDIAFETIMSLQPKLLSPDQVRMSIVGHNLRALANVLLIGDANPEEYQINIKQTILGLLSASEWLMKSLPNLDNVKYVPQHEQEEPNE